MKNKQWTKEELDLLQDKWGITSIPAIAAQLGRSINAIKVKAFRLGLRRHLHSGTDITLLQLCEALGKRNNYGWVKTSWVEKGLPVRYRRSIKKKYATISIDAFWKWAEQHKNLLDFSTFPPLTLGKEPDWVFEKRHADSTKCGLNKRKWSPSEDEKLKWLLNQYRHTYDELCHELNRSESSIKRRISTLGIKQRPLRRSNQKWTAKEISVLVHMFAAGYDFDQIGHKLNRSGLAVRGKYERLTNPEYMKQYHRRQNEGMQRFFQKDMCLHYVKMLGCTAGKINCDDCRAFIRRAPGHSYETGWNSIASMRPEEVLTNLGGEI